MAMWMSGTGAFPLGVAKGCAACLVGQLRICPCAVGAVMRPCLAGLLRGFLMVAFDLGESGIVLSVQAAEVMPEDEASRGE